MSTRRGELGAAEPHPAASLAVLWVKSLPLDVLAKWQAALSSCAIEGNRLGEVCAETLRRLMNGEEVGDRYVLGLAWAMRSEDI